MMKENKDYELIPVGDSSNDFAWEIRILTGNFTETIIRFGCIRFNKDLDCLTFDFSVIYSPYVGLSSKNLELQEVAGQILEDVLEHAIEAGSLVQRKR